ncbi:MAG TPA: sugar ABC transporter ATP-binding protein, partial [Methylomirabilota bacterium]|nr:sugar ABC transporter ATP-binding protein [Methylomirabilota bacterium]
IYISHTLSEVFQLCEEVVILRDGEVVGSGPTASVTTETLISLMVGRTINQLFPTRKAPPSNEPLLEVRALSQPGALESISFTLRRGEVLGLFGLMGAGRSELARTLFGLDPRSSGEVRINGQMVSHLSPRALIERGAAFLTENRRSEGLCMDGSVAENVALPSLRQFSDAFLRWISTESLLAAVERIRNVVRLDAKTHATQPVRTLSGGNQQKVVFGKWLLRGPRVLLLDEPTRGIDVGAKFEIYQLIHDLADGGAGVFVISSEMEELMGLCDRILVMRSGQLVDELARPEFDRERILRVALHSTRATEAAA